MSVPVERARAGVLLLSHCGFAFMEDLTAAVARHGLERYILTSRPVPGKEARAEALGGLAEWVRCSDGHELTADDVARAVDDLRASGVEVRGCITVWESYRGHMAAANRTLGVADVEPGYVDLLRDKLGVRQRLHEQGLSRARADLITADNLDALKRSGRKLFVKPVRGLASYGTFALRDTTTWDGLRAIARDAERDAMYRGVIDRDAVFLAEDFIEGRECSFEVLVVEGRPYVLALHEKVGVTQAATTVFEDMVTAPPWTIAQDGVAAGVAWLAQVLAAFDVRWGCYHVEARYDGRRWDLIEINPRIGGSLISHSVQFLTGGRSLVQLWLDTLLAPRAMQAELAGLAIDERGRSAAAQATFFRVFFGSPGRIARIEAAPGDHPASIVQILVKPQDEIPDRDREVFLAQLLWAFDPSERDALLPVLVAESARAITIEYEAAEAACVVPA